MAENVIDPPREIRKLTLSKREFQLRFVIDVCTMFTGQPVTVVTMLNLAKKKIKSLRYRKKAYYLKYSYGLHIDYFSYIKILLEQNYSFLWCYVRYFNYITI